jgi:hypothetical protein
MLGLANQWVSSIWFSLLRHLQRHFTPTIEPSPEKFYKGGSQEKTHLLRPEFFLLSSPCDQARSVLNFRAMDSGAGHSDPAIWVFSTSGFHRLFATKPVGSETSKQYGGQVATIVLSGTRSP